MFPIVGGRKVEHLKANIEALKLRLTKEDMDTIDGAYDFDLGFPHNFLTLTGKAPQGPQDITIINQLGHFDYVAPPTAIEPFGGEVTAA